MLWFIPPLIWGAVGALIGGAIGYALDSLFDWLEKKYPDATLIQIFKKQKKRSTLGKKISKTMKNGEYLKYDNDPLGLAIGDEEECMGVEELDLNDCGDEVRNFFDELEEGDFVDLNTGEVYYYEN